MSNAGRAVAVVKKESRPRQRPARKETPSYASLMRLARGPFWLGSISKLTRSPPASESKLTLESSPVRWKKYSFPSSAAMNPKPRSWTSFLMVPVGIEKPPFSKASRERTRPFEKIRPRRTSPDYRGQDYLTTGLEGQQRDAGERRGGPRQ